MYNCCHLLILIENHPMGKHKHSASCTNGESVSSSCTVCQVATKAYVHVKNKQKKKKRSPDNVILCDVLLY